MTVILVSKMKLFENWETAEKPSCRMAARVLWCQRGGTCGPARLETRRCPAAAQVSEQAGAQLLRVFS